MRPVNGRDEARWFLDRGLPSVLSARWRRRRLWRHAAPSVAALAAFQLVASLTFALPDFEETSGSGTDELAWGALLGAMVIVLVAIPILASWFVHRLLDRRRARRSLVVLTVVSATALGVAPVLTWLLAEEPLATAVLKAWILAAVVVLAVFFGLNAMAWWALRHALAEFGESLQTLGRVLPLLLVVLLVFFTGELWQWAAMVDRPTVWRTIAVMAVAGVGFMALALRDAVGDVDRSRREGYAQDLLHDTPFATADLTTLRPASLTRPERLNILVKLLVAQLIQVVIVMAGIFVFFLVLGAVMLPDQVIASWSAQPVRPGDLLGITMPVSRAVLQMSILVAAISGLYFAVNSSTDPRYRAQFLDPLVAELGVTLAARDVYLGRQRSE